MGPTQCLSTAQSLVIYLMASLWLAPAFIANTMVAENGTSDCVLFASITSMGVNLDSDGSCMTDITPPLALGPLADNGPTETHALLAGSPAIDAGGLGFCTPPDQRGFLRDATCDIGALEFGASGGSGDLFADLLSHDIQASKG